MAENYFQNYFEAINQGLLESKYYYNQQSIKPKEFFESIKQILDDLRNNRNRIFFFGNGASAAFANHMALDFSKNGKIISRSLSDSALLTALSNDYTFESAMLEYLKIEEVNEDDLVVVISSSGNSPNILNVLSFCKAHNVKSLSLSGLKNDNKSISLADYSIYVPKKTYGIVECIHQIFLHLILDESMQIFEWDREDTQNMNHSFFRL